MHVKSSTHFCLWNLLYWYIGTKKIQERTKTSDLIVYNFSLTFVNLPLAGMLCLHVWL